MRRATSVVAIVVVYLAVYLLAAGWSRAFAGLADVSAWYLAPAATLVLLVLASPRFWPAVFVAEVAAGALAFDLERSAVAFLLANAAIATAAYTIAAIVLRRRMDPSLSRLRDLLLLTVVGGVLAPLADALLSTVLLVARGTITWEGYLEAVRVWWVGSAIGVVSTAPLAFLALTRIRRGGGWPRLPRQPTRWLEWLAQATLLAAAPLLVFGLVGGPERNVRSIVFVPLVWIALRHGLLGASIGVLALNTLTTLVAGQQLGPGLTFTDLQTSLVVIAVVGLSVGGVVSERDAEERERLETERQLRLLEGQLARSRRMQSLGRLAGGVAHDFNNLLTVITGYAELLEHRLRDELAVRPSELAEIRTAAARAGALIEQLRAFSAGAPPAGASCSVDDALREFAPNLTLLVGPEVAVQLSLHAAGGHVPLDRVQLERILLNIATNSRDAMSAGGRLDVTTRIEPAGADPRRPPPSGRVVLRFADTGHGIPAEALPHVLEPFYTTKPAGAGSGLGLATIYGLTQQIGGTLDLLSQEGRGTTVELRLPLVPPPGSDAAASVTQPPTPAATWQRVLVVEDDPVIRELLEQTLTGHGYEVLSAPDGERALAIDAAQGDTLDVLVSDVTMPGISGLELVARLRARGRYLPVLLVSGYASAASPAVTDVPGQAFLAKPFTPSALLAALDELARRQRADAAHGPRPIARPRP